MDKEKVCPICGKYTKEKIVDVCATAYEYIIKDIKKTAP